jgi:magnesium chelatase family protein
MNRISGPLLDRIDIQVEILPVPFESLSSAPTGEKSEVIRQRVIEARALQTARFADEPSIHCNAQMGPRQLAKYAKLSDECLGILREAMTRLDMSARAYDRIVRVARTIADLDHSVDISPVHIREAVNYRNLDRATWGTIVTKAVPVATNNSQM